MYRFSKNIKTLGNIIIILGIILIAFSLYFNMQIKLLQEKKLEEYSDSIEEEPIIVFNENNTAEKEEKQGAEIQGQENDIDRDSIIDLRMVIQIPKIGVEAAVVNGTTPEYLKEGPGLYEISPLPGDKDANVLIAGHRTTYGAWFRKVDKLVEGDDICIGFGGKNYNYKVEKIFIVVKNDWSVTEPQGYSSLTLTACHPPGSSRQRIVVRARLDNIAKE
jgi:LPXTG-site transpeptidase (sortase) family protein